MDLSRLGFATAALPAGVPARRCPVNAMGLLSSCRVAWEQGAHLVALWGSDERDRERGYTLNVVVQDPGGLVLTDKFWREVGCPENRAPRSGRPKRLKNRLLIGLELENAKLDYAYSPLGFRTSNFELNLALYAAIQFNYSPLLPAGVSAGLGIETRF